MGHFSLVVCINGDTQIIFSPLFYSLFFQSKKALTNILQKCVHLPALEPLLSDAPPNILKHVVGQFAKVLPHDAKARKLFVTSGGLKKVQEINPERNTTLSEHINAVNNCYPEEIVRWVTLVNIPSKGAVSRLFSSLLFILPILITVFTLIGTICRKIWAKALPKSAKRPFPVEVCKCLCLSSIITNHAYTTALIVFMSTKIALLYLFRVNFYGYFRLGHDFRNVPRYPSPK